MKTELTKKALEKVGNPHILINLVARRVRQLNAGGGAYSRPLIDETSGLSATEIALKEIAEEKITWEPLEDAPPEKKPIR